MKREFIGLSSAVRLLAIITLPCLLVAIYLLLIRPSQLQWGATAKEVARSMPGDDLVPFPSFCATRGITVRGTLQEIWPWLAQMGYRRAGFYGYDLIENLGSGTSIRSADKIIPELQHPKTGEVLPISAAASMAFGSIQPGSYIVWRGNASIPSDGSIVWALYPVDATHTRLVNRVRLHYHWTDMGLLSLDLFTEFADPVAVPRILLGVKGRVEGLPTQSLAEEAAEIVVWFLALAEFLISAVLIFRWRRWGYAWLLGFAAGLSLMFALYAHKPVWMGAALSCGVLAGMIVTSRTSSGYSPEI